MQKAHPGWATQLPQSRLAEQPPVGARRWLPPTGPKNWTGTIEADWFGNSCPQKSNAMTLLSTMSEDCLYLNVYRPNKPAPPGGFPVMVFVYGGSWETGSGSFFLYWSDHDIGMVEDVIMVTINYRLGRLGFFRSVRLLLRSWRFPLKDSNVWVSTVIVLLIISYGPTYP